MLCTAEPKFQHSIELPTNIRGTSWIEADLKPRFSLDWNTAADNHAAFGGITALLEEVCGA